MFSTDADTVFPLQAMLGYDITQTLFVGRHTLLVEGPSDLLYLKWFSGELERRERQGLDQRWVIAPAGGLGKVSSFVTLFGANALHVAVLADIHRGAKRKVRDLRESDLLRAGHVFSADAYAGQEEADIEDILGRTLYTHIVSKAFNLSKEHGLPATKPADAPARVVEEVERQFKTLPPDAPSFDHYTPAAFLVEEGSRLRKELPDLDAALDRFERLFRDLNALL